MSADESLRKLPSYGEPNSALSIFRRASCEFFAMTIFVFIGCGTAMVQKASSLSNADLSNSSTENPREFQICFAFGMAIVCLVYSCWSISGGHLNPAVTTALMISGHLPIVDGVSYIIAQLCGSLVAGMLLAATIPDGMDQSHAFATNAVQPGFSDGNAFCGEFMMTCLLLFVVYHTAVHRSFSYQTDTNLNTRRSGLLGDGKSTFSSSVRQFAPLAIGMAVFAAHCVLVPITGCSINPARTLGPLIVGDVRGLPNDDPWNDVWIFMVAPMCAALFMGLLFPLLWKSGGFMSCWEQVPEKVVRPATTTTENPIAVPVPQMQQPCDVGGGEQPRDKKPDTAPAPTLTRQQAKKEGFRGSFDAPTAAAPIVSDTVGQTVI